MRSALGKITWNAIRDRVVMGRTIFLDIDGTLLAHTDSEVSKEMREHVAYLTANNAVHLLTNTTRKKRAETIAHSLRLPLVPTRRRKPNTHILKDLAVDRRKLLVIGDKATTDLFFAWAVGAECILVERLTSPSDSFLTRVSYWWDDAIFGLLRFFSASQKIRA